ncbi:MAG: hypothetical protein ACRD2D_09580 [Terriglobales bacterium]
MERRSFILGTAVVWVVVLVAVTLLVVSMEPQIFTAPQPQTRQQVMARMKPLTAGQQWEVELVFLAGAVGLFFLNYRFSYLLRRPHFAFAPERPGTTGRWLWWVVLSVNSYFFFPQIVITPLLARWGTEEIKKQLAASN